MSLVHFPFSDSPGISRDIEPYRLPPGVWSDGLNMLFRDQKATKAFGYASFIASPTIVPFALFFCPLSESGFWLYPGLTKVRAFDINKTTADVTRSSGGDYTGGEGDRWTFGFLHGFGILTNGADDPQSWIPSLSNVLIDLVNWPASTTTKTIRVFRNFLIALDVTKSGTRHPQMVKWSHSTDPGTLPTSWDETDATKDAGEVTMSDTPGMCLDSLPLGGTNIIYKEDAAYAMAFIGGGLIFGFQRLPFSSGILARDCAAEYPQRHFLVTPDDIVTHNGVQAKSVIDGKSRSQIFNEIEPGGIQNSFVFPFRSRSEMWFCYATTGSTVPNKAFIWNWERDSTSFRELPHARQISYARPMRLSIGDTWSGDTTTTWASEITLIWDDLSFINISEHVFLINEDKSTIDEFDNTLFTIAGANERSFLERKSMPFIGMDNRGNIIVDMESVKFIREIYPRITGTQGAVISVFFGTQMFPDEAVTFLPSVNFVIGTTEAIPVYESCRFFSVRFEATDSDSFDVHGFSYDLEPSGRF